MKKLNKLIAVVIALAVMAMMCVVSAFAAPDATGKTGTDQNSFLTKYLQLPSGATVPDKTFTFAFAKASDSSHATTVDMPTIDNQTINTAAMTASRDAEDGNSLVGTINLGNLVKVTAPETIEDPDNPGETIPNPNLGKLRFTHAGEYVYTVTETNTATQGDGWTYDGQTYTLRYVIKNGANGLEVEGITVQKGDQENSPKVDPTDVDPSDDEEDATTITAANVDGFTFVNKYQPQTKPIDPDPENPQNGQYGALGVAKTVAGENASKEAVFPFEITLVAPAGYNGAMTVDAYIYNGETEGAKVPVTINANDAATPVATSFELKHGDSLVFPLLPDGVTYLVNEKLTAANITDKGNYTPAYTATKVAAEAADNVTLTGGGQAADKGKDLPMSQAIAVNDTDTKDLAAYTNTRDDITPTGILMNNLPYIVLALVAIGGLVAYVAVRRRQNDEA